jgi:hypothetical protein
MWNILIKMWTEKLCLCIWILEGTRFREKTITQRGGRALISENEEPFWIWPLPFQKLLEYAPTSTVHRKSTTTTTTTHCIIEATMMAITPYCNNKPDKRIYWCNVHTNSYSTYISSPLFWPVAFTADGRKVKNIHVPWQSSMAFLFLWVNNKPIWPKKN